MSGDFARMLKEHLDNKQRPIKLAYGALYYKRVFNITAEEVLAQGDMKFKHFEVTINLHEGQMKFINDMIDDAGEILSNEGIEFNRDKYLAEMLGFFIRIGMEECVNEVDRIKDENNSMLDNLIDQIPTNKNILH